MQPEWIDQLLREARVIELRHMVGGRCDVGTFDDLGALRTANCQRQDLGNLYCTVEPRPRQRRRRQRHARATAKVSATPTSASTPSSCSISIRLGRRTSRAAPRKLAAALDRRNRLRRLPHGPGLADGRARLLWQRRASCVSGAPAGGRRRPRDARHDLQGAEGRLHRRDGDVRHHGEEREPDPGGFTGTTSRKGDPTPDRPYIGAPKSPSLAAGEAVSARQVVALAEVCAQAGGGGRSTTASPSITGSSAVATSRPWTSSAGSPRTVLAGRPLGGGKFSDLLCPWSDEHSTEQLATDSSSVIWEAHSSVCASPSTAAMLTAKAATSATSLPLWGDADRFCSRAWSPS